MDTDLFIAGAAGTNKAMKSIAASKKMAWYIYIPGKTALDALWALGVGTAAPSKDLERFVAHAAEQKKKVFTGKVPRVTIGGETLRVFQPKGKAPPGATLFRDATVMGMKAGAATQIPKLAKQIFFSPDMASDTEAEEAPPAVVAVVVEQGSAVAGLLVEYAKLLKKAGATMDAISLVAKTHEEAEPLELLGQAIYEDLQQIAGAKIPAEKAEKVARDRLSELQELDAALTELLGNARASAAGKPKRLALRTKAKDVPVKVMEAEVQLNASIFEAKMLGVDLGDDVATARALIEDMKAGRAKPSDGLPACDRIFASFNTKLFAKEADVDALMDSAPSPSPAIRWARSGSYRSSTRRSPRCSRRSRGRCLTPTSMSATSPRSTPRGAAASPASPTPRCPRSPRR